MQRTRLFLFGTRSYLECRCWRCRLTGAALTAACAVPLLIVLAVFVLLVTTPAQAHPDHGAAPSHGHAATVRLMCQPGLIHGTQLCTMPNGRHVVLCAPHPFTGAPSCRRI